MSTEMPASRRRVRLVILLPVLALFALLGTAVHRMGILASPPEFHGTPYLPPEPAADFVLTEHTGEPLRLSDLRGRTVLLFFGYTHCPDVCPLTLTRLRGALDSVGAGRDQVRVLLVTVDPERDTPAALARYVERFGPAVSGLTGPAETLNQVYRAYGVHAEAASAGGEHASMLHTSAVFGIDRHGRIRVLLRPESGAGEALEADLRTLLRL